MAARKLKRSEQLREAIEEEIVMADDSARQPCR